MIFAPDVPEFALTVIKGSISEAQWLELVEGRRRLMLRYLDFMPLPELGMVPCMQSESSALTKLGFSPTAVGDEGLTLHTRGIFRLQPWRAIKYIPNSGFRPRPGGSPRPDGTKRVWGLTQAGQWVVATVVFKGTPGYKDRGAELVESIEIRSVDLGQLLSATEVSAQSVWAELGEEIKRYTKYQGARYLSAQELEAIVAVGEVLVSQVLQS